MALATITSTTIESNSYNNIFETIDNRSNIADPRTGTDKNRIFVYDSEPLHKSINFGLFPYMVLELPEITYSEQSADGKHKFISWVMNLTVRAVKDGSSGFATDTGRRDVLAIGDDLNETFNKRSIRDDLGVLNIHKLKLIKISNDTPVIVNKLTYEAKYQLEFMTRMVVST